MNAIFNIITQYNYFQQEEFAASLFFELEKCPILSPLTKLYAQLDCSYTEKVKKVYQDVKNHSPDSKVELNLKSMRMAEEEYQYEFQRTLKLLLSPSSTISGDIKQNLQNRIYIYLPESNLKIIPFIIKFFENIQDLNLGWNVLTRLPPEIGQLKNLRRLFVSHNKLREFPQEICQLERLWLINMSHNCIKKIPSSISQMKELQDFHISHNQLSTSKPLDIAAPLKILDFNNNHLSVIPLDLSKLQKLTSIHLTNNFLKDLPKTIGLLNSLTRLELGNNQLLDLPIELAQLTQLLELELSQNYLEGDILAIANLTNLTRLNLSNNNMTFLSSSIGGLKKLGTLDISCNFLDKLPPEIGELRALGFLMVQNNFITQIPDEIENLMTPDELDPKGLIVLHLENNPLLMLPSKNIRSLHLSADQLNLLAPNRYALHVTPKETSPLKKII